MRRNRFIRSVRCAIGAALVGSLGVTCALLVLEGRWREAIPLHLCSLSALCAACLALRPRAALLDFLWYLGMPGALLALLFPAPAVSRWQALLDASYFTTHALIVIIPLFLMAAGMRPASDRAVRMFMLLQAIALCAFAANRLLGTDFFFLMAPPADTPLEAVFAWGYAPYLIALESLMLALCLIMDRLARWLFHHKRE